MTPTDPTRDFQPDPHGPTADAPPPDSVADSGLDAGLAAAFGSDDTDGSTADFAGKDEHVGAVLAGKYKLIEGIGEGGMGAVYMAQQTEPVKRLVAVKVIKAGMDSKAVLARFEAERQALAMMDHPNIARVLDAGTTESGRPYFVMELVKGVPITQFCDERKLTPRQRLELFVQVCNAIQHAHQKGVIHRDIKPSNVLVALYDDRPVPKVIDFGVAKAAGQTLTDKTLMTGFGAVVGTPEYMSPEQASLNNLDIDTRSDVYALGVLLYELLTGTTPVDRKSLGKAALLEILRIVREVEAPRPSHKLSTADALPSLSANRGTEPRKLTGLLRSELDWIVLKALEKDRTRRYETANGFAADVQRYLAGEAIQAHPPSRGYRLRKFVRRNKVQVVATSLVFLALVAGVVGMTVGLVRAIRAEQRAEDDRDGALKAEADAKAQRSRAEEEKRAAEAVRAFLQDDLLRNADAQFQATALGTTADGPRVRANPTVRELLDRAAAQLTPEKLQSRFPNLPFVQAEILRTVGSAYTGIGEYQSAQPLLARATDLHTTARGPDDLATIAARKELAVLHVWSGQEEIGLRELEGVCEAIVRVRGRGHRDAVRAQFDLAYLYYHFNRFEKLLPLLAHLCTVTAEQFGPDDFDSLLAAGYFAFARLRAGEGHEPLTDLERVWHEFRHRKLRLEHPGVQNIAVGLSMAYRMSGQGDKARRLLEDALRVWEEAKDGYNPATWQFRHQLAFDHYVNVGKVQEGVALLERNVKAAAPPFDEIAIEGLSTGYLKLGRVKEALDQIERVLALVEQRAGPALQSYQHGRIRTRQGITLLKLGRVDDAERPLVDGYREMIAHLSQQPSYGKGDLVAAVQAIVQLYRASKKPDAVVAWEAELAKISESNPKAPKGN